MGTSFHPRMLADDIARIKSCESKRIRSREKPGYCKSFELFINKNFDETDTSEMKDNSRQFDVKYHQSRF